MPHLKRRRDYLATAWAGRPSNTPRWEEDRLLDLYNQTVKRMRAAGAYPWPT